MSRTVALLVLMLLATGAGIAAASTLIAGSTTSEPAPEHLLPGPAELMVGARADDPSGGPEWAARTYVSRTGLLCVERGRLVAGIFGDLDAEGRIEPRPGGPTGICGDPADVVAGVEQLPARGGDPDRTVVLGASLRRPSSVTVTPAGSPPVELAAGSRGAFIGVFPGLRDPRELPLAVVQGDGAQVVIHWVGEPTERRDR
jgi:hypothetical protein